MATIPLRSAEILARLRAKYAAPEYAFFAEVANGTGAHANRRADGLCMSLWPSRGLSITGFEIKVSRQDLVKELKDPSKADAIAQFCDYWYLVLGHPELIRKGELPQTWGLLLPHGKGLRIAKEAERLEANPISRKFLASILRAGNESSDIENQIKAAVAKAKADEYARGHEAGKRDANYRLPHLEKELVKLKEIVNAFSEASGIDLMKNSWRGVDYPAKLGEAVGLLLDGGAKAMVDDRMKFARSSAEKILEVVGFWEDFDKTDPELNT